MWSSDMSTLLTDIMPVSNRKLADGFTNIALYSDLRHSYYKSRLLVLVLESQLRSVFPDTYAITWLFYVPLRNTPTYNTFVLM